MSKNNDTTAPTVATPPPEAGAPTDIKHDDAGIKNAFKSKAPGNHANAKITAQPGSQGTIDLHKRKLP